MNFSCFLLNHTVQGLGGEKEREKERARKKERKRKRKEGGGAKGAGGGVKTGRRAHGNIIQNICKNEYLYRSIDRNETHRTSEFLTRIERNRNIKQNIKKNQSIFIKNSSIK